MDSSVHNFVFQLPDGIPIRQLTDSVGPDMLGWVFHELFIESYY